jgi:uncharacterized small protein (DUF1192 family)
MAGFDDEAGSGAPRKAAPAHELGQNLDALSVNELAERIELLKAEILRLEAAMKAREATRNAASAFFKA